MNEDSNPSLLDTETKGCEREGPEKEGRGGVSCLLLPLKHGANGLNLVEAQHVVLIEPLLNPGAEAQAINRVHRIGQTRETTVHRFIVSSVDGYGFKVWEYGGLGGDYESKQRSREAMGVRILEDQSLSLEF